MTTTMLLASIIGPIYLCVGIGLLLNQKYYAKMIKDFKSNYAMVYFAGATAMAVGIAIILHHNIWTLDLAGLMTLVGALSIVKGVLLLVFPEDFIAWSASLASGKYIQYASPIVIVIGGYVTYLAYIV